MGNRSRIFNVLLNNIPFDQWPAELSGTSGFPFHDAAEKEDFGDTVETLSPQFKTQMQNIRDAVWSVLSDLQKVEKATATAAATPEVDDDTFTIYLGEVADTLRTPRKRVIAELQKKGFIVLEGVPPPDEAPAHELATNTALGKADLSIHLLDALERPTTPANGSGARHNDVSPNDIKIGGGAGIDTDPEVEPAS